MTYSQIVQTPNKDIGFKFVMTDKLTGLFTYIYLNKLDNALDHIIYRYETSPV